MGKGLFKAVFFEKPLAIIIFLNNMLRLCRKLKTAMMQKAEGQDIKLNPGYPFKNSP
jgi:hypothetical protein